MSYNTNFYHNVRGNDTFQNPQSLLTPPPMLLSPQYDFPVQPWSPEIADKDIIKQFENKIPKNTHLVKPRNSISISEVHDQIRNLVLALNEIKSKQKLLSEKMDELTDDEWTIHLKNVEEYKATISKILSNINNLNMDILRKLLAKRSSKRARQKQQRIVKRKHKEEMKKQNEEKSRKIDEYLKRFQDDINKAKQEEEAKLKADAVLKDTIRKKQDAKKYIVKLNALVKLRKARMNTAKGRGESVSVKEAEVFEVNIEKLKSMWSQRLVIYETEESELCVRLQQDSGEIINANETEKEVQGNLEEWKDALFGGVLPQVDFGGDISIFLAVRSQWDQYLNVAGSSIPIGWVLPSAKTSSPT